MKAFFSKSWVILIVFFHMEISYGDSYFQPTIVGILSLCENDETMRKTNQQRQSIRRSKEANNLLRDNMDVLGVDYNSFDVCFDQNLLLSTILRLLLDSTFYVVENPKIIRVKSFKIPIFSWQKQSRIFGIFALLPADMFKVLANSVSVERIPLFGFNVTTDLKKLQFSNELTFPLLQSYVKHGFSKEFIIIRMKTRFDKSSSSSFFVWYNEAFNILKKDGSNICIKEKYTDEKGCIKTTLLNGSKRNQTILMLGSTTDIFNCLESVNGRLDNKTVLMTIDEKPNPRISPNITSFQYVNIFDPLRWVIKQEGKNSSSLNAQYFAATRYANMGFEGLVEVIKKGTVDFKSNTLNAWIRLLGEKVFDETWNGNPILPYHKTSCDQVNCTPGLYKIFGRLSSRPQWDVEYGYKCVRCDFGLVKDYYGDGSCYPCHGYLKPNAERGKCIDPFVPVNPNLSMVTGKVVMALGILGATISLMIKSVFIKNHSTPVVKLSDRSITFPHLLVNLLIFSITPFTYLTEPSQACCIMASSVIAILYNMNISIVFIKSHKLLNAFKSPVRRTENEIRKTSLVQMFIIFINLVCGVLILFVMSIDGKEASYKLDFSTYQKFVYCNNQLQNNILVAFMILIQLACFYQAYRCRKLPRYLNDAMSIVYGSFVSTLSFSVSFPISYYQKNGQDATAVILLVVMGNCIIFLMLLYGQKMYIILFRPSYNTPQYYRQKQLRLMESEARELQLR